MLKLSINRETKCRVTNKAFSSILQKFEKVMKSVINAKLAKRAGTVDLVLMDDEAIAGLNAEYRGKKGPTDVITFAYLEVTEYAEVDGEVAVADVFISVDTAKKQAKEKKHSLEREMMVLFVHGMLHAFGFDHNTDEEEEEMEGWAKKVLE